MIDSAGHTPARSMELETDALLLGPIGLRAISHHYEDRYRPEPVRIQRLHAEQGHE